MRSRSERETLDGELDHERPDYGADETHETVRLFEPAPEQMPGQLDLDVED